jgi:NAD(P)H-hydrate epimerase
VLSGSIGAFLAQGLPAPDAAALAVFVGSRAGDRAARRYGTLGVISSDLPVAIAEELCALESMGA